MDIAERGTAKGEHRRTRHCKRSASQNEALQKVSVAERGTAEGSVRTEHCRVCYGLQMHQMHTPLAKQRHIGSQVTGSSSLSRCALACLASGGVLCGPRRIFQPVYTASQGRWPCLTGYRSTAEALECLLTKRLFRSFTRSYKLFRSDPS